MRDLTCQTGRRVFRGAGWTLFPTQSGVLALRLEETRADAVLAYPRGVDVTHDLHFRLPSLLSCQFKGQRVRQNLRKDLAEAKKLDRDVNRFFREPARKDHGLKVLQRSTQELSEKIEELTDRTARVESALRTLDVNRKLVRRLLGKGTTFPASPELTRL